MSWCLDFRTEYLFDKHGCFKIILDYLSTPQENQLDLEMQFFLVRLVSKSENFVRVNGLKIMHYLSQAIENAPL